MNSCNCKWQRLKSQVLTSLYFLGWFVIGGLIIHFTYQQIQGPEPIEYDRVPRREGYEPLDNFKEQRKREFYRKVYGNKNPGKIA